LKQASALYRGHVMHRRLRPKRHRLAYRLAMVFLDLDELEVLDRRLRLFSLERWNLFSFRQRDHGDGTAVPLREQIVRQLQQAGMATEGLQVRLLTMPRLLGFVFNPISIYFCSGTDGGLRAIVYEVSNTFGQRHSYLLEVGRTLRSAVHQSAPKRLHVSPFMAMDQTYSFRVTPPGERLAVAITSRDEQGPLLCAVLEATRQPLSDAALLRTFGAMPLMTLKVVAAIGWEALKLWLKRVPVHRLPPPPNEPATVVRAPVTPVKIPMVAALSGLASSLPKPSAAITPVHK
jgi:DUF1365 family protein